MTTSKTQTSKQRESTVDIFDKRRNHVPVWFMRQAGRYHRHYQGIRKSSDFMTMCKTPDLAEEITLGPIRDFEFNAAILFSDLLFPLEFLSMGLDYDEGPPRLARHLKAIEDLEWMNPVSSVQDFFNFQGQAVSRLANSLPLDVTLLGFVGAPFTLFAYAVEGSHKGDLRETKKGLYDGRFNGFCDILIEPLVENMAIQADAGADAICLFDTTAGELCAKDYSKYVVPKIHQVLKAFKKKCPDCKITYYSKMTHLEYIRAVSCPEIDTLGVDWRVNFKEALLEFSEKHFLQGNIDPAWLHLDWKDLENNLNELKEEMSPVQDLWKRWIFGLGHGVTVQTPEENVRKTVKWVQENLVW